MVSLNNLINYIILNSIKFISPALKNIANIYRNQELREAIIFVVQVFSLIFLIIYVWKTWQMASATSNSVKASEEMLAEMKETRDQESAPYVVPYIDINHHIMFFGIKNIGRTVAKDIKLFIEPELKSTLLGDKIKEISFIKNGVSSLPPGHSIGTKFDVSHRYLNRADSPMKYLIKITYKGGIQSDDREHEQVIDLSVYKELIPNEDKRLSDAVKELENIAKNNQSIRDNLENIDDKLSKGLSIRNPELIMTNFRMDDVSWKRITISKLKEIKLLLSLILTESKYQFSEDTQVRVNTLLGQILFMASSGPSNINVKICDDLNLLSLDISEFLESITYLSGRDSADLDTQVHEFDKTISELIKTIEQNS